MLKLDPRVEPMFRNRPQHERFLAVAMLAILSMGDKNGEMLEEVLSVTKGVDVDWTEVVGGKPLLHYNGKTRAQLIKEGVPPKTIGLVAKAFERRGMKLVSGEAEKPAAVGTGDAAEPESLEPVTTEDKTPPAQQPVAPNAELFAGKPLEFFSGLSRDQILGVEGINPATADKILAKLEEGKPADPEKK